MNLKTNHQNNWAVIKPKSTPQKVFVARDNNSVQMEQLQTKLEQVRQLIIKGDLAKLKRLYEQGGI